MTAEITPEHVQASRRAAALWAHWQRGDIEGIVTVTEELDAGDGRGIMHLICALLNLGDNMVKAARDGQDAEHLDYVLRVAAADESTGDR